MPKLIDLTNTKFGKLTVIKRENNSDDGTARWLCQCECGNSIVAKGWDLRSGHSIGCGCTKRYKIPIGEKFNKLTIVSYRDIDKYNYQVCHCKCECGNYKDIRLTKVINGKTKSCGCLLHKSGKDSHSFSGYKEISGSLWNRIKRNRTRKEKILEFNITIEYIWDLFVKQDRKCALSRIELVFGSQKTSETTASLDRIDSSKGYIEGNVQWVHKDINTMKMQLPEDKLKYYCRLITLNDLESKERK